MTKLSVCQLSVCLIRHGRLLAAVEGEAAVVLLQQLPPHLQQLHLPLPAQRRYTLLGPDYNVDTRASNEGPHKGLF